MEAKNTEGKKITRRQTNNYLIGQSAEYLPSDVLPTSGISIRGLLFGSYYEIFIAVYKLLIVPINIYKGIINFRRHLASNQVYPEM